MTHHASAKISTLRRRGVLKISGLEKKQFLQGLITNDIEKVSETNAVYAALLTPQGKFLFDFFIVQFNSTFYLDCERARAQDLNNKLKMYKLRADVEIENVSDQFEVIAFFGSDDKPAALQALKAPGQASVLGQSIVYRDPRLAELGHRLIVPLEDKIDIKSLLEAAEVDEQDYNEHRLQLGVPEGGLDIIPDKSFILESNFDELRGVDHKKGCYIGQEVTSRTKRKAELKKRILPIQFEGTRPSSGSTIIADGIEIGSLVSVGEQSALALIRMDRAEKAIAAQTPLLVSGSVITIVPPPWIDMKFNSKQTHTSK